MNRFADEIEKIRFSSICARLEAATRADVERALGQDCPDEDGLLALFSKAADSYLEELAQRSARITRQRFGETMQLYAPLYVSNECVNRCAYCGFSVARKAERRTLDLEEFRKEAMAIRALGIWHILLVSGESPRGSAEKLAHYARAIRAEFSSVSMEVGAQGIGGYGMLVDAGVDGLTLYQESYDSACYRRVHLGGPKANFEKRLEAIELAGEAGFRGLGIGALLGLSDGRAEAYFLSLHGRYLQRRFWRSRLSVSFPRIQDFGGVLHGGREVSNRTLVQMICAMRIALPDAELVLSTRESADLRDNLIGLGITRMSAESKTVPGGYLDAGTTDVEQFAIQDNRTIREVVKMIELKGKEVVLKDFDRAFVMK